MNRRVVNEELQSLLIEFVDVALTSSHAGWNVTGPHCREIRRQLDELAGDVRGWADDVAGRLTAVGHPADGRIEPVATLTPFSSFPAGFVEDTKVVGEMVARMEEMERRARSRIDRLRGADRISEELAVRVAAGIEKYRWMLASQQR